MCQRVVGVIRSEGDGEGRKEGREGGGRKKRV